MVPIKMVQGERQFNLGGVGMDDNASMSYDDKDDLAPPSPYGNFEISFAHPEHFMKKFSRDVVPTAEGFTWTFLAETEVTDVATLSWDNSVFRDDTKDLFLLDVYLQRPINMKEESAYLFDPNVSHEFKVFFGKDANEKLRPNRVMLGQAVPNPTSGSTSISFSLPEYSGKYQVSLEIFDMLGRKIATVTEGEYASGFYKKQWNETEGLSDGLYTYRLTVRAGKKREVIGARMILKR